MDLTEFKNEGKKKSTLKYRSAPLGGNNSHLEQLFLDQKKENELKKKYLEKSDGDHPTPIAPP